MQPILVATWCSSSSKHAACRFDVVSTQWVMAKTSGEMHVLSCGRRELRLAARPILKECGPERTMYTPGLGERRATRHFAMERVFIIRVYTCNAA